MVAAVEPTTGMLKHDQIPARADVFTGRARYGAEVPRIAIVSIKAGFTRPHAMA
jgi:hypothetical protein